MAAEPAQDLKEAHQRLARFLNCTTSERMFVQPTCHPALPTTFCFCEHSLWATLRITLRGWLLETSLRLPWNAPKLWLLRRLGARIGQNVYISAGAWIDPLFPHLLTIEDEVFLGTGVRIHFHEFRRDEFRAGKVTLRRKAMIGAYAILACGIEVGTAATVAGAAVVGHDVPPGTTAIGNPARIVSRAPEQVPA